MPRRAKRHQGQPVSLFSFQDIIASITGIMVLVTLLLTLELISRTEMQSAPEAMDATKIIEEVERKRAELAGLEQDVGALGQTAADLAAGKTVTQEELDRLKAEIAALERLIGSATTQVRQSEKKRDAAKDKSKQVKGGIKDLEGAVAAAEAKKKEEAKKSIVRLLAGEASTKRSLLVECSDTEIGVGEAAGLKGGKVNLLKRFTGAGTVQQFLNWAHALGKDKVQFVLLVRPQGIGNFSPVAGTLQNSGYTLGWDVWPVGKSLFPQAQGGDR